jgi:hypothetical protein
VERLHRSRSKPEEWGEKSRDRAVTDRRCALLAKQVRGRLPTAHDQAGGGPPLRRNQTSPQLRRGGQQVKRFIRGKRSIALFATLVVAAAAAFAAYAYFTGSGTGSGSAQTATPASLTVTQIGAGYDSLIPSNAYHQDQCFQCAQVTEFGNEIKLAKPGLQRLTGAVVAFRNWGGHFNNVPITLSIVGGPSSTVTPNIPAAQPDGRPTVTTVSFPFNNFVNREFVYKISFDASGAAGGLNVALSSSPNNLSVGTDSAPGHVWINTAAGPGIDGDFPACTTPGTGFAEVQTNCGTEAPGNPGAYGTNAEVAAGNADIPAVEFNVLGGVVPSLYPGGPAEPVDFAITNPGNASVYVHSVTIAANGLSGQGNDGSIEACDTSMYPISQPSVINTNVPTGTTFYSPSGASISMNDDGNNQDNCEGATVNLSFTAG